MAAGEYVQTKTGQRPTESVLNSRNLYDNAISAQAHDKGHQTQYNRPSVEIQPLEGGEVRITGPTRPDQGQAFDQKKFECLSHTSRKIHENPRHLFNQLGLPHGT